MYGILKRPRERQRRDHCRYLLTSSSMWILDEVIPANSASLVVSYNNTIQLEQTVIKEELQSENFAGVSLGTSLLPKGAENKSAVEVDKDAEAEDTLYIKFEEDCDKGNEVDHKGKDSLIDTDEEVEYIGTGIKDKGKGDTRKDMNEKLRIGKSFSSVYGRIKTVDGQIFYECDYCTKLFKNRSHIAVHRRSHTKEKNFKCDRCTKSFTSIRGVRRHTNKIHNRHGFIAECTSGKVECDKCKKTYSTLETLNRHHICKMFKCDTCKKAYISLESLKGHICKTPTLKENVSSRCKKCEKVFHDERRLLQHVNFECYYTALDALKTSKFGTHEASR